MERTKSMKKVQSCIWSLRLFRTQCHLWTCLHLRRGTQSWEYGGVVSEDVCMHARYLLPPFWKHSPTAPYWCHMLIHFLPRFFLRPKRRRTAEVPPRKFFDYCYDRWSLRILFSSIFGLSDNQILSWSFLLVGAWATSWRCALKVQSIDLSSSPEVIPFTPEAPAGQLEAGCEKKKRNARLPGE